MQGFQGGLVPKCCMLVRSNMGGTEVKKGAGHANSRVSIPLAKD